MAAEWLRHESNTMPVVLKTWPVPLKEEATPARNAQRLAGKPGSEVFSLYPNPSTGAFAVNSNGKGELSLYNVQQSLVAKYPIGKGVNKLQLPAALSAGIYIGQYRSMDGQASQIVRLVYQP